MTAACFGHSTTATVAADPGGPERVQAVEVSQYRSRGKCSRAEPLRGGDAKLPAQTAFEQRVAGLPISEELIARSDTVYSAFDRAHQVSNDCRMESLEIENVVRAQH